MSSTARGESLNANNYEICANSDKNVKFFLFLSTFWTTK